MYIQNILDKEDCNSFIQKFQKIYSETGYKIIQRILTKRILIKLRIRDRGREKKIEISVTIRWIHAWSPHFCHDRD